MVRMAVRIKSGVLAVESANTCAVPANEVNTVDGRPISCLRVSMRVVAVPSDTPCGRLKDTVIEVSWPVWLTVTGPAFRSTEAKAVSGTSAPVVLERTRSSDRRSLLQARSESYSRITE